MRRGTTPAGHDNFDLARWTRSNVTYEMWKPKVIPLENSGKYEFNLHGTEQTWIHPSIFFIHILSQVGMGSVHVFLSPFFSSLKLFFPQGHRVTTIGDRGHKGETIEGG